MKHYDLEERTAKFAEDCRNFVNQLTRTLANVEYGRQMIRSSGSQAANYIEANESLSKKDFSHRIRICRKEAKETCLWLRLCEENQKVDEKRRLMAEAVELRKIFTAILNKTI